MGNHPQSWKTYSCPTSASQAFSLINRRVFLFRVPLFWSFSRETEIGSPSMGSLDLFATFGLFSRPLSQDKISELLGEPQGPRSAR